MNLKVKFAIILGLTALCAWEVWPPQKKIKLGIDLEGGTSLLYQIDTTGYTPSPGNTAAQEMIRILQQRIDPAGNAGLVWRAHGSDRVEIQMPLASKESRRLREEYQKAKEKLSSYNLDLRKVREVLSGYVLGSPGGYPVYLKRWSRMGQTRDENLEHLLLLGEPEAVVAVTCASGLSDELARRAWWTCQDPDNARRMLNIPAVVNGSMGPELARFLIEYLPFE